MVCGVPKNGQRMNEHVDSAQGLHSFLFCVPLIKRVAPSVTNIHLLVRSATVRRTLENDEIVGINEFTLRVYLLACLEPIIAECFEIKTDLGVFFQH